MTPEQGFHRESDPAERANSLASSSARSTLSSLLSSVTSTRFVEDICLV
jgi:hypothetical protein